MEKQQRGVGEREGERTTVFYGLGGNHKGGESVRTSWGKPGGCVGGVMKPFGGRRQLDSDGHNRQTQRVGGGGRAFQSGDCEKFLKKQVSVDNRGKKRIQHKGETGEGGILSGTLRSGLRPSLPHRKNNHSVFGPARAAISMAILQKPHRVSGDRY